MYAGIYCQERQRRLKMPKTKPTQEELKERILKEMLTGLDEVQRRLGKEIFRDLSSKELKPKFQRMTFGELHDYIERRIKEASDD
jgi:hypothetical protein